MKLRGYFIYTCVCEYTLVCVCIRNQEVSVGIDESVLKVSVIGHVLLSIH